MIELEYYLDPWNRRHTNLEEVIGELQQTVSRLQTELAELRNKPMIVINNPPIEGDPLQIGEITCQI